MVTLWLVTNVECDSITALVDLFVRHNDCPVVQCMMADKDMLERESEREVTTSSHPDLPLSCPAHLPARGDQGEMDVSQEQRLGILSILQRLTDSEEIHTTAYVELVGLGGDLQDHAC